MRVAIYYAPDPNDPLWQAACQWLGRDPETAATVAQPAIPGLHEITASPRRYGFHATLKPPMRLATAYDSLLEDVAQLASSLTPFDLPGLAVRPVHGFLALRETSVSPQLRTLADRSVAELDQHRAPAPAEELARRRQAGLTPEQDAMLVRWGYPHVLDTWFFHMTLTRRLNEDEDALIRPLAEAHFAAALARPRQVEALTVFTQAAPGAPFLIAERLRFGSTSNPRRPGS